MPIENLLYVYVYVPCSFFLCQYKCYISPPGPIKSVENISWERSGLLPRVSGVQLRPTPAKYNTSFSLQSKLCKTGPKLDINYVSCAIIILKFSLVSPATAPVELVLVWPSNCTLPSDLIRHTQKPPQKHLLIRSVLNVSLTPAKQLIILFQRWISSPICSLQFPVWSWTPAASSRTWRSYRTPSLSPSSPPWVPRPLEIVSPGSAQWVGELLDVSLEKLTQAESVWRLWPSLPTICQPSTTVGDEEDRWPRCSHRRSRTPSMPSQDQPGLGLALQTCCLKEISPGLMAPVSATQTSERANQTTATTTSTAPGSDRTVSGTTSSVKKSSTMFAKNYPSQFFKVITGQFLVQIFPAH